MHGWRIAPAGSRRQAVRRRFNSVSSRLLHRTILDFRLRLLLLAALTLPFILLGGCVHALASGHPWTTSAYLVYGLLFRVPSLGAVRQEEPAASALVLNAVFLFGTFGFAILLGLIGEEVKGTVKALRAGGTPLDLYDHVVLLNFTADATAVALLRQVAEDVATPGSPLYGRPIVVLASPPPPLGSALAHTGGGAEQSSGGGSSGDVEGAMKRVVADALQGRGSCEWHLRVGSSCRTDDLARVCATTASYIVLLADPRVATSSDATAAGAASCLQAQSLMCLSLAMGQLAPTQPADRGGSGSCSWRARGRGRATANSSGTGGAGTAWSAPVLRPRQQATIVVQSPADAAQPLSQCSTSPGGLGLGSGPISTFRAVAAGEGNRPQVIQVCDRGIVDRLVAQTVLQPGVATVLARLFGGSGGQGSGFRWVEWSGFTSAGAATTTTTAQGATAHGTAAMKGYEVARTGNGSSGGADFNLAAAGLRRRRLLSLPRTLSYSTSHRSLMTAAATGGASATFGVGGSGNAAGGGQTGCDGPDWNERSVFERGLAAGTMTSDICTTGGLGRASGGSIDTSSLIRSQSTNPPAGGAGLFSFASAAVAAICRRRRAPSCATEVEAGRDSPGAAAAGAAAAGLPAPCLGGSAANPLTPAPGRMRVAAQLAAGAGLCPRPNITSRSSSSTFGEVRSALEAVATVAAASDPDTRSSRQRGKQSIHFSPSAATSLGISGGGSGGGGPQLRSLPSTLRDMPGLAPVLVGYMSAATGTLRLNPRDASPVYPGDKLVLLVSEQAVARGPNSPVRSTRSKGPELGSRSSSGASGGNWLWGGGSGGRCRTFLGLSCGGKASANSPQTSAAVASPTTPVSSTTCKVDHTAAGSSSASGCSRFQLSSTDTVAVAAVALGSTAAPAAPPPLQGWYSGPPQQSDEDPLDSVGTHGDAGAGDADKVVDMQPSAAGSVLMAADGTAANGDSGAGKVSAKSCGGVLRRTKPAPRTPAAPPSHIIVISRTAAAVREVLKGLQEYAPAGSTIVLLTHEPGMGVRPSIAPPIAPGVVSIASGPVAATVTSTTAAAAAAAAAGAGCGGSGSGLAVPPASTLSGSSLTTEPAAGPPPEASAASGVAGSGPTVVLPCPSSSWPVSEGDLGVAGLAVASAVLVVRDSGLQPHEADATALSTVLQLHQTLTDPTRSPLRRCSQPSRRCVMSSVAACAAADKAAAVAGQCSADDGVQPGVADPSPLRSVMGATMESPDVALAEAAARAAAGGTSPAPLHVVVCLHSTRSRATLRSFLAGLNAQPPFTLEALVPEEYRALLLAGVVRQPQSHAIMTDLLSDRPGAPEVYLVPLARLLAVVAAQRSCSDPTQASEPHHPPECPAAHSPLTLAQQPEQQSEPFTQSCVDAGGGGPAGAVQLQPGGAMPWQQLATPPCWSGLPELRFCDAAAAARSCGCTAIGVLRGGAGGDGMQDSDGRGGGGGPLQLAPCPNTPLDLAPEDRLVVLSADPV